MSIQPNHDFAQLAQPRAWLLFFLFWGVSLMVACMPPKPVEYQPPVSPLIPVNDTPLTENNWRVVEINYQGALVDFSEIAPVTVIFDNNDTLTAKSAGCNTMSFTIVAQSERQYRLTDGLSTLMGCGEVRDQQYGQVWTALEATTAFDLQGDQLLLVGAETRIVLTVTPSGLLPDPPLAVGLNHQTTADGPAVQRISVARLYAAHSFEEMTDLADTIFIGKVIEISPVQWNQDNGEYWEAEPGNSMSAMPIRYITIDPVKPIVPEAMEGSVKITSLTDSVTLDEKNNVVNQADLEHGMKIGDQVLVFVRQTELAWRGGVQPATMLMGAPYQSYFKLGEDGLYHGELLKEPLDQEGLLQKILDERASPPKDPLRHKTSGRWADELSMMKVHLPTSRRSISGIVIPGHPQTNAPGAPSRHRSFCH